MSLVLRMGDQVITAKASRIQTKNVALGGYASVTFTVDRELDQSLFDTFTDVFTYDPQTGEQTGGGRLLEQGRNDDGTWSVTCLGEGLASMQDRTTPVFYIDGGLDNWNRTSRSTRRFDAGSGSPPDGNNDLDGLLFEGQEDKNLPAGGNIVMTNRLPALCDMRLGSLSYIHKSGADNSNWRVRGRAYNSALSTSQTPIDDPFLEAWSDRRFMTCAGDFSAKTVAALQWLRVDTDKNGSETDWNFVRDPVVRSQLLDASGSLTTSGYGRNYVLPHEVLTDWVARYCPRLDATRDRISSASTEQIEQLAYLDGIHGMQLAEDLQAIEPALTWQVWDYDPASGRWPIYYQPLSTKVRYEATVADGFSAPTPTSEIYNRVTVTGKLASGRDTNTVRTSAVPALDNVGMVREATIPLGSEVWSVAAAAKVGDEFLREHKVAPNAGTLTIARKIYDREKRRFVKPWAIRAGGLIRVRGIQPTPDTLNATSPDGVTVFRIVAVTYDNDSGAATCELDTYDLTTARAIAKLARARRRRN